MFFVFNFSCSHPIFFGRDFCVPLYVLVVCQLQCTAHQVDNCVSSTTLGGLLVLAVTLVEKSKQFQKKENINVIAKFHSVNSSSISVYLNIIAAWFQTMSRQRRQEIQKFAKENSCSLFICSLKQSTACGLIFDTKVRNWFSNKKKSSRKDRNSKHNSSISEISLALFFLKEEISSTLALNGIICDFQNLFLLLQVSDSLE